jgi:hypothetical protein
MDDHHHRFILQGDPLDDLALIGWEVKDEQSLDALTQRLQAAGVTWREGDADARNRRCVVNPIEFTDPNGICQRGLLRPPCSIAPSLTIARAPCPGSLPANKVLATSPWPSTVSMTVFISTVTCWACG